MKAYLNSPAGETPRNIVLIQELVAAHYSMSRALLLSPTRQIGIAWPRMVAMSLTRELTKHGLQAIARSFGMKDHGTVLHAIHAVAERYDTIAEDRAAIDQLRPYLWAALARAARQPAIA